MIVYGIPNCDSVKKAVVFFKQHRLNYQFHDYKQQGITKKKLKEWCTHFGWEKVLNKQGTTFRALPAEEQLLIDNEKAAINFMADNTSSIKRPIVEFKDSYLIRFNEEEYKAALL